MSPPPPLMIIILITTQLLAILRPVLLMPLSPSFSSSAKSLTCCPKPPPLPPATMPPSSSEGASHAGRRIHAGITQPNCCPRSQGERAQHMSLLNPASPLGDRRSNEIFLPSSTTPSSPSGRGLPLPLPPPLDLDRGFREVAEGPFWPKMAPRRLQRAQDGLQDGPR